MQRIQPKQPCQPQRQQWHQQVANQQHRNPEQLGVVQRSELHARTGSHQPQRQRCTADAADAGLQPPRNVKPCQVGEQAAGRADDQRVTYQFTDKTALAVACHGPHRTDVHQWHTDTNQQGHQRQPRRTRQLVGQGQANERIEPKRNLGTARMLARGNVVSDTGPVRHGIGQRDTAQPERPARQHHMACRTDVQRTFDNRLEQQHRKKQKVHQLFHLRPHWAVQWGKAAHQVADQNQRKIGEQQLGKVHALRIAGSA